MEPPLQLCPLGVLSLSPPPRPWNHSRAPPAGPSPWGAGAWAGPALSVGPWLPAPVGFAAPPPSRPLLAGPSSPFLTSGALPALAGSSASLILFRELVPWKAMRPSPPAAITEGPGRRLPPQMCCVSSGGGRFKTEVSTGLVLVTLPSHCGVTAPGSSCPWGLQPCWVGVHLRTSFGACLRM